MARQEIQLGSLPNGVGGDTPRTANTKINDMTTELYAELLKRLPLTGGALTGPVTSSSSAQLTSIVLNSPTATLINGGVAHTPNTAGAVISLAKNADAVSELITYNNISSAMPRLQLLKARGDATTPTIVSDGDFAGTFQFFGYGGDVFRAMGGVFALVDGPPVANTYVPGRVEFRTTLDGGGPRTVWQFRAAGHMQPGADNAYDIGSPSLRARVVYAGTGAINTSDAREKTDVRKLGANELGAAKELAREIGAYKFLHCVKEKGQDARDHIGMTVQRAIAIMQSHNLNPYGYGFICHDTWEAGDVLDDDGEVREHIPAGDRYGFRMDELLAFIAAGFEARLAALEQSA
ncbi:hypothetical protein HX890_12090 [Pseudomonas gingeri]|uniref:tail fiber domain-containing protein n=1 Tax=Pseudomonas gingeri TaxID=117681 RepID=UPI0015A0176B|nr:tail fiber domain-containing protein [Pseudomonas gingeri]NWD74844.1 hypothetical protein [Pseudomonas gingeri]